MRYPAPIRRWARRRLAASLPRLEARAVDERSELARLQLFERNHGGHARDILYQEKAVAQAERRVEKARAALSQQESVDPVGVTADSKRDEEAA